MIPTIDGSDRREEDIRVLLVDDQDLLRGGIRIILESEPGIVVARFISVLELYRHAALSFEQLEPLGELTLRWSADHWSDESLATLGADYDR